MDYGEAIEYLLGFSDLERGVQKSANPTMSLASVRSLLARLNDPQTGRSTVHVTGSKGKGSTASMVAGIIRAAGQRTSLYTSPHLHAFTERISVDSSAVSKEEFAAGLTAIWDAVEAERASVHGDVSTFGVLTSLFFWLTRAQVPAVGWQVVEVGLGGTFDATNVFDGVDVAVITPISLEHTAILGNTPAEIATDKAGIIKPGSHCVLARQDDPAVVDVVRARCRDVGATLVYVPEHYDVQVTERHVFGQAFIVESPAARRPLRTQMLGFHQVENAATAVAVADVLRERGLDVDDHAIELGIAHTRVKGRLEVMGQRPLVVADGAHNAASAAALARALREYFDWKRCFLVLGCTRDKDVRAIGFQLARMAEMIVCCGFANPRAMDPFAMIPEVGFLGPMAVAEPTVSEALDTALTHAGPGDLVCATGSLYVAAEARVHMLGEAAVSA